MLSLSLSLSLRVQGDPWYIQRYIVFYSLSDLLYPKQGLAFFLGTITCT